MIESAVSASSTTSSTWRGFPSFHVARKGVLAVGIKIGGAGLSLVVQVSLARVLGQSGYGQYAYAFSWMQLMLMFAQGGFAMAAMRYVAEYRARSQPELVRGFLRRSSQIVLVQSVILALFMAGCAVGVHGSNSVGPIRNLIVVCVALPVVAQFALNCAFVRGFGRVITSMLITVAHPAIFLVAVVLFALIRGFDVSSTDALIMNLCAATGSLAIVGTLVRRLDRDAIRDSTHKFLSREWLVTATQMMFTVGLIHIQGRTGVIISGLFLDASEVGKYAAVERLADGTLLGLMSVSMLAAPKFSALYAQGRSHELQRYVTLAAWGASGFMFATALPLILFGKPILRVFGENFISAYPVLIVLLCGVAVSAICGSVGYLLNMTGHHRETVLVAFCSLVVNLALSLVLIPRYGIMGTAVSFATSLALWNVSMTLVARKKLGLRSCIGPII